MVDVMNHGIMEVHKYYGSLGVDYVQDSSLLDLAREKRLIIEHI